MKKKQYTIFVSESTLS